MMIIVGYFTVTLNWSFFLLGLDAQNTAVSGIYVHEVNFTSVIIIGYFLFVLLPCVPSMLPYGHLLIVY